MTRLHGKLAWSGLLVLFMIALCAPAQAETIKKAGLQYKTGKTPAWVVKIADPAPPATPTGNNPTRTILADIQVNLLQERPVQYVHNKIMIVERAGLETASTVKLTFNPSFETLTIHDITVHRSGKAISRLKASRIDLVQRENRLEQGVYDEDVQAIVAVDDVRVGDVLEYAYSIDGQNPVFEGKFAAFFGLNGDTPIDRLSIRLTLPTTRKLAYKVFGSALPVTDTAAGMVRTLAVGADYQPQLRPEPNVPPWVTMYPFIEITEYDSWEQVQQWASRIYKVPQDLDAELERIVREIADAAASDKERAAKALAWVQNEIRYYSIAVGTSSHRPNHPNLTFRQRFGDCKDKSVLLSAMLQRLGIAAAPALVSYRYRRGFANWLATPQAFDHVIVRADIDGKIWWLDGTQTHQGDKLETLGFTEYGKALPTDPALVGLTNVVAPPTAQSRSDVTETFRFPAYGAPADMTVEYRYTGSHAEWFRRTIATNTLKKFVESIQTDYGRDFPNIALSGETGIVDDRAANTMTLTQSFRVPVLFTYERGLAKMNSVYARTLIDSVRFPRTPTRQFSMALPYPSDFNHRIVLTLPHEQTLPTPPAPDVWQDRHILISNSIRAESRQLSFDYRFKVLADQVEAADFPAYSEKVKKEAGKLFSGVSIPLYDFQTMRTKIFDALSQDRSARPANAASIISAILLPGNRERSPLRAPDNADSLRQGFIRDQLVADAVITAGNAAGPVLAAAYRDRAEALSLLDRRSEALNDIEQALAIETSDESLMLKAEIQIYLGLPAEAKTTLAGAAQSAGKPSYQRDMGTIEYYLGHFDEAQRHFAKAAEVSSAEELPHILIWLAIAAQRAGSDAKTALAPYRARTGTTWPVAGIQAMLDEIDDKTLLEAAQQDEKESRMRLCEAYFYLGQKSLLAGNTAAARQWFGKSVETDVKIYREHTFSQHELKRL